MLTHIRALIRSRQLHFRAETFGLYFPAIPGRRRFWQVSVSGMRLLASTSKTYESWLEEMRQIAAYGPEGWWQARDGGTRLDRALAEINGEAPTWS